MCKVKTGLLSPEEVRWGENKLTKSKKNFMFCIPFALLPPSGQMWKALNKKCNSPSISCPIIMPAHFLCEQREVID